MKLNLLDCFYNNSKMAAGQMSKAEILEIMLDNFKSKFPSSNDVAELKKSDIDLQESEMGIVDFINEELPHCDRVPQTERILQKNQSDWLKTSKALLQRQQLEPRVVKALIDCEKKHKNFKEMLLKDARASKRLDNLHQKQYEMSCIKGKLRNMKHSQVRARQYYKDYELGVGRKMQQLDTAGEQAFCGAVHKVVGVSKGDMRDLEERVREKEQRKVDLLKQRSEKINQEYKKAVTRIPEQDNSRPEIIPMVSGEHRSLLKQVQENIDCLNRELSHSESRAHHRHLHINLLPHKIPRPVLHHKGGGKF